MTEQELDQLRREKWRLNGNRVRTLDEARAFIESVGFCLMYPLRPTLLLPTFIGAWSGSGERLPTQQHAFADPRATDATELMVRLLRDRSAYEANFLEENNAFLLAASIFPYFYALVGERNPKQPPKPGPRSEYSQLACDAFELIRRAGPISKQKMREVLGGSVSFAALDHALGELWSRLRITRVDYNPAHGSSWDVLYRWSPEAVREGISLSVGEALSALLSKYLDCVVAADQQEIEALAAGLKSFATWNATATLQECRECCGGKGYLSENRIEVLKNDTDVFTTFEGDNTVLMQLVAKSRLTEFKQEFAHMNLFGILNYVADQAKTSITELNPIIVRKTDEDHLLDPEFHMDAFEYRERDILTSAAKRLKRHIDQGMDSFDAFNVSQHHLVQVGFAYIERIVLEKFIEQVENTSDKNCQSILKKLCALFALSQIDKNKGWYLEQGYMSGAKTKAIRKLLNQLCWDVRQEAVPLVDAFAIPASCLAAPIVTQN